MRTLIAATVAAALAAGLSGTASADTLDDVLARGKLVAGTKTDYAPWGMRDKDGNIIGMEIDMINDFAARLSAKYGKPVVAELEAVVASNRMQFLEQGKIDMMIATMSDKSDRREVVGIVQPNYYSSGVAVFAKKDSSINGWDSIKGKNICGTQGAWYNKDHGLKNGAEMIVFKGVPEIEQALLDGRCEGWLYDDSAFIPRMVLEPEKWNGYAIKTPVVDAVAWGAAVRKDELSGRLGKELSAAIIDWHKTGKIVEWEKKWGIPQTQWVLDMQKKCMAGEAICNDVHDPGE